MKDDFLTIPDAPNYEINSQLIVRNKTTGRILTTKKRIGKNAVVTTLWEGKKQIKRDTATFRRQALAAVQRVKWYPIPSLGNRYEMTRDGKCRNAKTKKILKLINVNYFIGYSFYFNNKQYNRTLKDLMWEVFGLTYKQANCTPVPTTLLLGSRVLSAFNTLADCARFISRANQKKFATVYRNLRNRPAKLYGYQIVYKPSKDLTDVKYNGRANRR